MRIAVCDDDKAAREHIVSLIQEQGADTEITAFAGGEEMLRAKEEFDIMFLDIEMEGTSGLETARRLRRIEEKEGREKSVLIFVTGYERYVYDAFDVSAFQYLLKPLQKERFAAIFARAWKEASAVRRRSAAYLFVKSAGMQRKVYLKDILYIESADKKVVLHTKTGILETYGKMNEWERAVGGGFYRCHRCYLVNMEQIVSYGADHLEVLGGDRLLLAQKKYAGFIKRYLEYAKNGGAVNV